MKKIQVFQSTASDKSQILPEITLTEVKEELKLDPAEPMETNPNYLSSQENSPSTSPLLRRKRSPTRISSDITIDLKGATFRLNQYLIKEPIGNGSTSKVFLAENLEDGNNYALKVLSKKKLRKNAGWFGKTPHTRKSLNPLEKAYKEISILKKVDHPNVVKLVEVLDNEADDGLYLVFELSEKGEVMKVPTDKPFTETEARSYFRDVVLGLEYLHYQKIIHRDIKPQNLLVASDGRLQIADLGVCSEFEGNKTKLRQSAATPAFTPPEAFQKSSEGYCGKALDVWCLGCTLYAFVFGDLPFGSTAGIADTFERIKSGSVNFPSDPVISPELRDLLSKMLAKDPAERITIPLIKVHEWVTYGGLSPLPSEEENCVLLQVSPEEIKQANPMTVVKGGDSLVKSDSDGSRSSSGGSESREPLEK